jgi:hypothetical protein
MHITSAELPIQGLGGNYERKLFPNLLLIRRLVSSDLYGNLRLI